MIQIRRNLFETNSSSTHSITMCTKSDYEKWEKGELVYDMDKKKFIPASEVEEIENSGDEDDEDREKTLFKSPEEFYNWIRNNLYNKTYKTEFNDVVAFGYYGQDY